MSTAQNHSSPIQPGAEKVSLHPLLAGGVKTSHGFFRRELVTSIWCWRVKRGQVREGVGELAQSQTSFFNNGEKVVANGLKGAAAKRTASKRQFVVGRFRGKDGNRDV